MQFVPLLGEHGLEPVGRWVQQVPFRSSPSLFYFFPNDAAFRAAAWLGVALVGLRAQLAAAAMGAGRPPSSGRALWVLYLSFVNIGQTFYGFGWETLLCEVGFFTIFAGAGRMAPNMWLIWIWRWMLFRLMFGAGLIKLRGDSCWRDLTCLDYYFETQPMPNPLSWYFHWLPHSVHAAGVVINHIVEVDRAVRVLRAAAVRVDRRPRHDPVPGRADRVRQPVVAELADGGAVHPADQRSMAVVAAGPPPAICSPVPAYHIALYVVGRGWSRC